MWGKIVHPKDTSWIEVRTRGALLEWRWRGALNSGWRVGPKEFIHHNTRGEWRWVPGCPRRLPAHQVPKGGVA